MRNGWLVIRYISESSSRRSKSMPMKESSVVEMVSVNGERQTTVLWSLATSVLGIERRRKSTCKS